MDSIFIFGLALILFGPKKLPEIGRQIGKIVLEFRKASNEFKMQIEDELRASEQAERQKKDAADKAAWAADVAAQTAAGEPPALGSGTAPGPLAAYPPSIGEQVPSSSPYRTGAEQLAAVSGSDDGAADSLHSNSDNSSSGHRNRGEARWHADSESEAVPDGVFGRYGTPDTDPAAETASSESQTSSSSDYHHTNDDEAMTLDVDPTRKAAPAHGAAQAEAADQAINHHG